MSSSTQKVFSNTVVQLFGRVITTVLGILTIKLITNNFGINGYGDYVFIITYLALFGTFADMGLFTIGVKEMSQDEKQLPKIFHNILGIRLVLAFSVMLLAVVFAYLPFNDYSNSVHIGIIITALATFLAYLSGTLSSVLQVKLKMQYVTIAMVLSRITSVSYIFYTIWQQLPFYHIFIGALLGGIINLVLTTFFASKFVSLKITMDKVYWQKLIKKSFPYGLALILNTVYFKIDILFLKYLQGEEAVGIYGVGMKILEIMNVLPAIFMNSVLPVLASNLAKKRYKVNCTINKALNFLFFAGWPIVVGSFFISEDIIALVSSSEFVVGALSLKLLMIAMLFSFLNTVFAFLLISLNQQSKMLLVNGSCVLLNIILNILIIPYFSYNGAAFTSVISELFILIFTMILAHKFFPYKLEIRNLLKIMVAGILMGLVLFYLKNVAFFYQEVSLTVRVFMFIMISSIIYFVMLRVMGVFRVKEFLNFRRK